MCRKSAERCGMTLVELLVVIAIYALLLALVLPAIQRTRATVDRIRCGLKLRQLAIALHLRHGDHGAFPPGCSSDAPQNPYPHMSWMTHLLPYLEQDELWRQAQQAFAAARFFQDPPHHDILRRRMALFSCPADERMNETKDYPTVSIGFTSYLGVLGSDFQAADGILYLDSATRMADVHDGLSNTLIVGERPPSADGHLGWWYAGWGQQRSGSLDVVLGAAEINRHPRYPGCGPGPFSYQAGHPLDPCAAFRFWSLHPGGANFAFADASVRFLPYGNYRGLLKALATRDGHEPTDLGD